MPSRSPTNKNRTHVIGLISDTHGLMRPQALAALQDVQLIIHAGDIGAPEVLRDLKRIAPIVAIKGNNDREDWAKSLPDTKLLKINGKKLYIIHNIKELDCDPLAREIQVVISGHSHMPLIAKRDGVLYVNPGSAGPRRFKLPVAVAKLRIYGAHIRPQIIELVI